MKTKTLTLSLLIATALLTSVATAQPGKGAKTVPQDPKTKNSIKKLPPRAAGEPVAFPDVAGWAKDELIVYPQRAAGYGINYDAADDSRVSIYVYNAGRNDISNSLAGPVKEEIEAAKEGVDALAEMGGYTDVRVVKDEKIKLGGKAGKIDVLRKVLSFKVGGNAMHSEIILFPFEGNFVKIRITRPMAAGQKAADAVDRLMAELESMFVAYMDLADAARTAVN